MERAEQILLEIKRTIEEGYEEMESGELLESDILENVYAILEEYFI